IHVVPLSVLFDDKEYIDGVDITKEDFYKMLRESDKLPKTSQVTYMSFKNTFDKYIEEGKTVLYIGGSSEASGTYQSAVMAKNDIEETVYTFDSLNLSIGAGCVVISAAKMAKEGKTVEEIVSHLENIKNNNTVLFTVDTLEYLQKGGRVSLAKATIGNMLNIKPILGIEDGGVKSISQGRGKKQVISKIIELIKEQHGEDLSNKRVIVGFGDNQADFELLNKKINEELKLDEVHVVNIGTCITAHSGPSVLGIACCDK
ncbi:MAG: DegV family protein, partial [Peptostreptococcaceae bacterium]